MRQAISAAPFVLLAFNPAALAQDTTASQGADLPNVIQHETAEKSVSVGTGGNRSDEVIARAYGVLYQMPGRNSTSYCLGFELDVSNLPQEIRAAYQDNVSFRAYRELPAVSVRAQDVPHLIMAGDEPLSWGGCVQNHSVGPFDSYTYGTPRLSFTNAASGEEILNLKLPHIPGTTKPNWGADWQTCAHGFQDQLATRQGDQLRKALARLEPCG